MKIVLDTDSLCNNQLGLAASLYLISMYFGSKIDNKECFDKLNSSGFIITTEYMDGIPIRYELSPDGIMETEKILMEHSVSEKNSSGEDRYVLLAEKMRELFPKGKKDGTSLQWRDSTAVIATRLKSLVNKYKVKFTDEQVLEATKAYVKSFNGDYRYMQILRYFIFKNVNNGGEIEYNSQLLSYLENAGQEEELRNDWMSTMV